jgi:hypothetical protein
VQELNILGGDLPQLDGTDTLDIPHHGQHCNTVLVDGLIIAATQLQMWGVSYEAIQSEN